MNPSDRPRREVVGRRETDLQLAELATSFLDLVSDVREMKELLDDKTIPRIKNLEEWRLIVTSTELERERNRKIEASNVINKRQFWIGLAGLAFTMVASATGLAALVLSHTS